ncbi:MAG: outer membrane beta-barrel protein [Proteobacteria bacterium]|nr:outer membrane beta-barrel protein [Pseudomonadota bacterium]
MAGGSLSVIAVLLAAPAYAAPGDHVQVGRATLSPSIDLGTEFRSNLYLDEDSDEAISGAALIVQPEIAVVMKTNEVILDLGARYGIKKYYWTAADGNPDYDRSNLDRYNDIASHLDVHALPNSIVGFKLGTVFDVDNRPTESKWADKAIISHVTSDSRAALAVQPGNAFSFTAGGHFLYDFYSGNPDASFNSSARLNSRTAYGPEAQVNWRFFPRTALLLDFNMDWFDWSENAVNAVGGQGAEDLGDRLGLPDGREWRLSAGLQGRVSHTLVINAMAGYGQVDYDEQSVLDRAAALAAQGARGAEEINVGEGWATDLKGLDGLLITTRATWTPLTGQSLSLGYQKDFQDSWFTNYVAYHYGFLRYNGLMASRFGLTLEGGLRYEQYVGELTRNDMFIRTRGGVAYNAADWMDLSLNAAWRRRVSADVNPVPSIEFDDVAASFLVTLKY